MNKIFVGAAAMVMAAAAWAADPKSSNPPAQESDQDTVQLGDTDTQKDTQKDAQKDAQKGSVGATFNDKDQAAIKDVANNLAQAFNNSDPKAAAATFSKDAVLIDPMGHKATGRDEIQKQIGQNMNGFLKDTSNTYTNIEVKMLKPDLAYLDMDHQITKSEKTDVQGSKPPPQIHVSAVLQKQGGKWLFLEARPATYVEEQPPAST